MASFENYRWHPGSQPPTEETIPPMYIEHRERAALLDPPTETGQKLGGVHVFLTSRDSVRQGPTKVGRHVQDS